MAGTTKNSITSAGTNSARPLVTGRHVDVAPDCVALFSTIPTPTAASVPSSAHTVSAKPGRSTPRPGINQMPTVRVNNQPTTANAFTARTALATGRLGHTNKPTP